MHRYYFLQTSKTACLSVNLKNYTTHHRTDSRFQVEYLPEGAVSFTERQNMNQSTCSLVFFLMLNVRSTAT